jgi:cytosine/adenosine deaminase-related metal-dependent hydrolase
MSLFWAARAWLPGGWADHVLLRAGADGHWAEVTPGVMPAPAGATVLQGPALPGLVNAHSHAFQRAFAGLAERRDSPSDSFWGWRDRMYQVALRITPEQLHAIAAHLYVELLRGGYTQVCDFHYLQHREDGSPYDDPLALSWALADAALDAGIGLTVLPVLYERAGFAQPILRADQRRFATTPHSVWALQHGITAARLFQRVADGSGRAAGFARWGLVTGARADLLVVDLQDHALLGVPAAQLLDALVFSSPGRPWRDVMVAGQFVIANHRHGAADRVAQAFVPAMQALWNL